MYFNILWTLQQSLDQWWLKSIEVSTAVALPSTHLHQHLAHVARQQVGSGKQPSEKHLDSLSAEINHEH